MWKWPMTYENEQTKHQSETKLQNYTTIVVFQSNVVLHKQECETLCWSLLTIIFHIYLFAINYTKSFTRININQEAQAAI